MPSALTDKFKKQRDYIATTLSSGIASNATSISVASATGWPTDTAVDLVIDRVDASGNRTPSAREILSGTVSGTTVTTDATRRGLGPTTAAAHSAGAVVEMVPTAVGWNSLIDGILVSHNQDGTQATNSVTTASITASAVTTPKLKPTTTVVSGSAGGDLTTASTSYADMATLFTHVAGATNERVVVECQAQWYVSANSGKLILVGSGTGVTTTKATAIRGAHTLIESGYLFGVFDVTAGNTLTVKLQGKIITAGTVTVVNTNATDDTYSAKLVSYGNA